MIISIAKGKQFEKNPTLIEDENYQQTWKWKRFFNFIKNIYQKTYTYIIFHCEKLDFFPLKSITKYEINKCILSSTVKLNENYKNIFDTNGIKILYFNHKTKIPIKNLYHSPETLGMDRLASVIGAYNKHPQNNILVIDMGTAITYDFINSNGEYLGGNISPGINMRLNALNHYTSKWPLIQKEGAVAELGYNTETAIRSGVLNGIKH